MAYDYELFRRQRALPVQPLQSKPGESVTWAIGVPIETFDAFLSRALRDIKTLTVSAWRDHDQNQISRPVWCWLMKPENAAFWNCEYSRAIYTPCGRDEERL